MQKSCWGGVGGREWVMAGEISKVMPERRDEGAKYLCKVKMGQSEVEGNKRLNEALVVDSWEKVNRGIDHGQKMKSQRKRDES